MPHPCRSRWRKPNNHHGAVSVPIYSASVFAFSDAEDGIAIHNYKKPGYFYGRLGNPTQDALETAVAQIEGGEDSLAFASGMAAVSAALFTFLKQGDHIVAPASMYSTAMKLVSLSVGVGDHRDSRRRNRRGEL
ncbi:MAG: PLP-dependent transferase [Blastocatellia bacterium]|nr:PLP-dependent transferase [Blastocatellia bacterium]